MNLMLLCPAVYRKESTELVGTYTKNGSEPRSKEIIGGEDYN